MELERKREIERERGGIREAKISTVSVDSKLHVSRKPEGVEKSPLQLSNVGSSSSYCVIFYLHCTLESNETCLFVSAITRELGKPREATF